MSHLAFGKVTQDGAGGNKFWKWLLAVRPSPLRVLLLLVLLLLVLLQARS
jgi:hypothetical protein